jgi:membrane protease YdiL (CAAX protease family)
MNPQPATSKWLRVMQFSLTRIVLAILLVGGAVAVAEVVVKTLKGVLSLGGAVPAIYYIVYLIASVLVAYFVYGAYVHLVEKRTVTELSAAGASGELGVGMLVGLGMVSTIVGALWLLGDYHVTEFGVWTAVFVLLANNGAGAFVEEVLLRGVVFRISEEQLGTWIALAISALLFVLLHLASPNATVVSAIIVGIEGGILLSAAYVLTRRLWLAIGIHFAWDFSQDAIFGTSSGVTGFVKAELTGPALLSGGSSGIEGSVLALLVCLAVSAYLLVRARRKGNFVRPFRTRQDHRQGSAAEGGQPCGGTLGSVVAWGRERSTVGKPRSVPTSQRPTPGWRACA